MGTKRQVLSTSYIKTLISDIKRDEKEYGDLDQHYAKDRLESIVSSLRYTARNAREGTPNPSKIPTANGTSLSPYRSAAALYREFRDAAHAAVPVHNESSDPAQGRIEENAQRIGLERDLQAALRKEIGQLEAGLVIIDDGRERSVDSGLIDITARDASGNIVVIELKAGPARREAVAQILSYMGDLAEEGEDGVVRGILVAQDFDKKTRSAARMVPNLALRRYSIRFRFSDGHD